MFNYAKESGEEQQFGTNYLKFSEISGASVKIMESLVGCRCVV